jgi:hypothetical protein
VVKRTLFLMPAFLDLGSYLTYGGQKVYVYFMAVTLEKSSRSPVRKIAALNAEAVLIKKRLDAILKQLESLTKGVEKIGYGAPRRSPLDALDEIVRIGRDLRNKEGRLSADLVAELYAVSGSKLAEWLGRNRQTVNKTPDAELLQEPLEFFERVARLTTVLDVPRFRKWLRVPNKALEGKRPLELMASRDWQVVADLVDDMLPDSPANAHPRPDQAPIGRDSAPWREGHAGPSRAIRRRHQPQAGELALYLRQTQPLQPRGR